MRKILYAIAFLFLVVSYSYSQGRTQDVVYLKNGSVIRGLIIEQVPNKSIKVQTRDESIFVYQMDEIEKLGKEEDTSYSFKKILGPKRTYDIKGYRGFLDLGYTTGDDGCIQFTTSHGYQLNPYFFFGAGTGVSYFTDSESALIPVFADLRGNFTNGKKVRNARGRSCKDKVPVFGMLQREGFVIAKVVSDTKAGTLIPIINDVVCPGSTIFSDEWYAYKDLDKNLYDHGVVYHKKGAYVIGDRHTNTIEGFWGHLKRTLKGVHHWVSRKHLQRYVDSSAFRYNTKHLSECERFDVLLQNIGHRLRYSQLN